MLRLLYLLIPSAHALDADTFEPSAAEFSGTGGLQLVMPRIGLAGSAYGGLSAAYALNPVVVRYSDGSTAPLIANSIVTHVLGGYNLAGAIRFDLDLPLYPYVGGPDDPESGAHPGDLRLGAVVPLVNPAGGRFALALAPSLSLPTGSSDALVGSGGVGAGLMVATEVDPTEHTFVALNVGVIAAPQVQLGDLVLGSSLRTGLGAGWRFRPDMVVGLEGTATVSLAGGVGDYNENPVEAHAYGTYGGEAGFSGTLAVGTGLVAGIGAPDVRIAAGFGYRWPGAEMVRDRDADGIVDSVDPCPADAEDADGFEDSDGCPEADNDGDGVADALDACLEAGEDRDMFEDGDGCPEEDNDRDGIADAKDGCPNDVGLLVANGCPDADSDKVGDLMDDCPADPGPVAARGCPDRDGDGVPDKRDACPQDPLDIGTDPTNSDGCRKRAVVANGQIAITEQVYFDANLATIRPESHSILDEVATVLRGRPDIRRVEVSGHTDSDGGEEENQSLSQSRAEAVVRYLVSRGKVDAARLIGIGYGETLPLDTNETLQGRTRNRRVEFTIMEQIETTVPVAPQ